MSYTISFFKYFLSTSYQKGKVDFNSHEVLTPVAEPVSDGNLVHEEQLA